MDRVYKIRSDANGVLNQSDIDTLNTFLSKPENDDFEIADVKEFNSGELLIIVSDV